MTTTLDPNNPSNFQKEGGQSHTAGNVLTLTDSSIGDFASFFAADADASAGSEIDVVTTFQVRQTNPNGADAGNRVVINDGVSRSAIAACIIQNGARGIGLLSQGPASDPSSYPVFVPVDWQAAPVSLRLRRTATGDAEVLEVNGVAPSPRALLTFDKAPPATRTGFGSVEFGCRSPEAACTVEYAAFRSERVVAPVTGKLNFTRFRLRDSDSTDVLRFRADYTLAAGSNNIDPSTEPVTIKLSTAAGQFYPAPDFNPLVGFDVQGVAPKRRWKLNDAERTRTNVEQMLFDEDPNNTGAIALRDNKTALAAGNYSTVNVEITIGTGTTPDKLTATVNLVEKPAGSGRWRLAND